MVPDIADHNLLFGILALQLNFITHKQLIEGMNAWTLEKQTPLGEILHRQSGLGPEEQALLLALVQNRLQRHSESAVSSLATLNTQGAGYEDLRTIADPDVQASLTRVAPLAIWDDPSATRSIPGQGFRAPVNLTSGSANSPGLRYRFLRLHAKGGLGQVSVAIDEELRREVALKEIQDRHADDPDSRSRFLLEAEITGGLEHPGIVPVYGLGTYADGRPYYAMRFIRGDSLKDALERFHRADNAERDPGERAVEFRKLLGRFLDVCNAIAYAHSRGVLHRDLKPGNIMLGKYGETLVVDWGLAKALTADDATLPLEEKPLRPSVLSGTAQTVAGSAMGTPQFMSPEQAAGHLELLGPASDVYSLGATLYSVLTGLPPFTSGDIGKVLQEVQQGDFPTPRQKKPDVPPALEAICLKAMSNRPEDRYPGPRDLAEDIEHWLADEPVAAYTEPWTTKAVRWVRRHRVAVGTAAAASAILLTVAIAGVLLADAVDRERQERKRADQQERMAQTIDRLRVQAEQARGQAEQAQQVAETARGELARLDYIRQIDLAHREWQDANIVRAQALLKETNPAQRRWEWGHVNQLCHAYLREWNAVTRGDMKTVSMTPDGKHIAAPAEGNVIKVWNSQTGEIIASSPVQTGKILCVAFSPDGARIASSAEKDEFSLRVWNVQTKQVELRLKHDKSELFTAAFSPDGSRILTAGSDHTAKLWDAKTGSELLTLRGPQQMIRCVAFSPDGLRIATARGDWGIWGNPQEVQIWDAKTGEQLYNLKGHGRFVSHVVFSPDGKLIATCSLDGRIVVWDAKNGQPRRTLLGHNAYVWCVNFSPDSKRIVSGGEDLTIKSWDVESGRLLRTILGHSKIVRWVTFNADGNQIYSASSDDTIKVWEANVDKAVTVLRGHVNSVFDVALSPDGKRLATASADGIAKVWDLTDNRERLSLGHSSAASSVRFSPDGKLLATSSWNGTIGIWNALDGRFIRTVTKFTELAQCVAFSPDGKQIASGSRDDTLRVSDVETGELILTLKGHSNDVYGVTYSPDGKYILSAARDATARVWDAATGAQLRSLVGHEFDVWSAVFSPDGKKVVTAGGDSTVRIWDFQSGKELRCMRGHKGGVQRAVFSPDGERIASCGGVDGMLKVWDVQSGQPIISFRNQGANDLSGVVFSPDGERLFSGGSDALVRIRTTLWDR